MTDFKLQRGKHKKNRPRAKKTISCLIGFYQNPESRPQNPSPGRSRHAESESEVKNLEILHPDLEIKENHFSGRFRCAESESEVKNLEVLHRDLEIEENHA